MASAGIESRLPLRRSDFLSILSYVLGPSLVMGTFSVFSLWALPWANEFAVPRRSVMLVYLVTGLFGTLLLPFVGRLIDRFAPWKLMMTGSLMMGGGLVATGLITWFPLLVLLYSVSVASGILLCGAIVAQSLAIRRFPEQAGTVGGMMMIGWALSSSVIPLLVTPILVAAGWRVALPAIGATMLLTIPLLCWTVIRRDSESVETVTGPELAQVDAHATKSTRQLLGSLQFWVILLTLLPMDLVQVGVMQNLVPFLIDLGVSPETASYVLSAKAAGLATGALFVGYLADRFDPRIVWSAASGVSFLALLSIATLSSIPIICISLVAIGIAAGGIVPLISVLLVKAFGARDYPPAVGLFALFMLPSQSGPFAAGWVHDATGSYHGVFLAGTVLIAIGLVAVWQFRSRDALAGPGMPEPAPLVSR